MRLYLVQHAIAASADVGSEPQLTERGRSEMQKVAAFLKPINLSVDNFWHSGKTRAAQTAQILTGALNAANGPAPRNGLVPNDDPARLIPEIEAHHADLMIVGHMPFLARLASRPTTTPLASSPK